MLKVASSLAACKISLKRNSRFSSSLRFNGFDRTLEPGATYRHPSLSAMELKIEEDPKLINANNKFSIYIPEIINNPLPDDAFDTELELVQWSSQFDFDNLRNYTFLVTETPGSVLAPGCNYERRLVAHMQWYWVFTMDDVIERLSMSRDKNTKLLTVALLANIRDLTTGREPHHNLSNLGIANESD